MCRQHIHTYEQEQKQEDDNLFVGVGGAYCFAFRNKIEGAMPITRVGLAMMATPKNDHTPLDEMKPKGLNDWLRVKRWHRRYQTVNTETISIVSRTSKVAHSLVVSGTSNAWDDAP